MKASDWTEHDLHRVTLMTLRTGLWLGILSWLVLGLWLNVAGFVQCWIGATLASWPLIIYRQGRRLHPSRSALSENVPDQIGSAIANLIRQRTLQEAVGERPETMLIPHIRIKLDIMIAAYRRDLEEAIKRLYDQGLPNALLMQRAKAMHEEVAHLCYNLRREPRQFIEDHFDEMAKSRSDLGLFESQVRNENSVYSVVPPLGL